MEELNGIVPSWGTRLSEIVCAAVGLIRVKGGRGVFIVWHEEVLQKTGDCSRSGILPTKEGTENNEEPIRKKHNKIRVESFVFCHIFEKIITNTSGVSSTD